ncbi:hypothetical protein Poly24_04190 [Rosistilla carotiformis]|uniref:Uncharacterized protein n=1 Tax=Rosistilla carotiformis TaxID=2528017 RepID=A0A518JMG5_9BACT|nr:hypothetical protein Poly24_04190 [Rosistilla carotiformis]
MSAMRSAPIAEAIDGTAARRESTGKVKRKTILQKMEICVFANRFVAVLGKPILVTIEFDEHASSRVYPTGTINR